MSFSGHTCQSVGLGDQGFLTLGIMGNIGLCQTALCLLSHLGLLESLGKAGHRHVLPLLLASEVLLQEKKNLLFLNGLLWAGLLACCTRANVHCFLLNVPLNA